MSDYAYWHAKLAGEDPDAPEGEARLDLPLGFWRLRDNRPLAVWIDAGGQRALRGFAADRREMGAREMERTAEMGAFGKAVPEADYRAAFEAGRWEDDPPLLAEAPGIGHNSEGDEDELARIKRELDMEAGLAETFLAEPVETKGAADKCATWARRVGLLQKRADEAFAAEKAPHLQACRDTDERWRSVRTGAKDLVKRLKKHVEPYLLAAKARRVAANDDAGPVNAGQPNMKVSLHTRTRAVIRDYDAFYAAVKDREEVKDFLVGLADRAYRETGELLPGAFPETFEEAA